MGDTPYLKVTQMGDNVFHMSSKQATSKELGEAMKSLFKWRGVNQDEVSFETGIPITSLSRKLNRGVFRYEEMCSIASILKVQLSTIITLAEWIHGGGDFERFAVEHLSPSSLNKSPVLEVTA